MSRYRALSAHIALVILLAAAGGASAATYQWNGGGNNLTWNTASNWSTSVLPGASDVAQFRDGGYFSGDTVTLGADQNIGRLAFNYTATGLPGKDLTIAGGTITLNGVLNANNVNLSLNRDANVSGIQTIDSNLILAASQQWNISGDSAAAGGLGKLVVNGTVGEAIAGVNLTKNGNTPVELNGDNTFSGEVSIIQNTLILGHAHALGLGTSPVLVGNTAVNTSQSNLVTKSGVTFDRNVVLRAGQSGGSRLGGADGLGTTTWTGSIALNKSVTLTGGLGLPTGTALFTGNIVDGTENFAGSGVTKANGGVVKLNGSANTYSGPTAVNAGTLLVNGLLDTSDSPVTVAAGARLGGTGTIRRPVTVAGGALLSPGDAGPGTLTLPSNVLTLQDTAILEWQPGDTLLASTVLFGSTATLSLPFDPSTLDPATGHVLLS